MDNYTEAEIALLIATAHSLSLKMSTAADDIHRGETAADMYSLTLGFDQDCPVGFINDGEFTDLTWSTAAKQYVGRLQLDAVMELEAGATLINSGTVSTKDRPGREIEDYAWTEARIWPLQ